MSILRGKSVTYGRYTTHLSVSDLTAAIPVFSSIEPGDQYTESFGSCSYRNLLDGPVDQGLLNGGIFHALGLRRDVKKAPASLVQAMTAQALADAATMGPLSKQKAMEIKRQVREEQDILAQPRPSHGMLVGNTETGVIFLDGPTGASAILGDRWGLQPLYQTMPEYRKFLAWMAWRGAVSESRASEAAFPMGACAFRAQDNQKGASFDGEPIGKLLVELLPRGWEMTRCTFLWSLGGEIATVSLDATTLKTTLVFPDEVLRAEAPEGVQSILEWRIANRVAFMQGFEEALAREVSEFLRRESNNTLEADFEELFPSTLDAADLPHSEGAPVEVPA